MFDLAQLAVEAKKRWTHGTFLEHGHRPFSEEGSYLNALAKITPWVPYEKYMMARLVAANPGQVGLLHIKFPPDTAEDNRIHTHLHSDRLITVMEGSGYLLIAPLGEKIESVSLAVGDRMWMPRGVRHTFYSGAQGLTLESIHNPFFALDDPDLLVYDEGLGHVEFHQGTFIEKTAAA